MSMSTVPPAEDPRSPSYTGEMEGIRNDILALWRRVNNRGGVGGNGYVIIQAEQPDEVNWGPIEIGQLWYDTDEPVS